MRSEYQPGSRESLNFSRWSLVAGKRSRLREHPGPGQKRKGLVIRIRAHLRPHRRKTLRLVAFAAPATFQKQNRAPLARGLHLASDQRRTAKD